MLLLGLVACQASPPVQEMSDARQAITAARQAGAAETAASELTAAEAHLASAREHLTDRQYERAREDALSAKRRALDALAVMEALRTTDSRPGP